MADTSLHTQRELQERLNLRNAANEQRRKEAVKPLSFIAGQLNEKVETRVDARKSLVNEREVTRAVIDNTATSMDTAIGNLQKIETVPNFVSGLLSIVDPDSWSRQTQRLKVQAAGVKLTQQKDKLSLARSAVEFANRGVTQSVAAIGAVEELTGKTDVEIRQAIATEQSLRAQEVAEKTREMEGLSKGQLDLEIKKGEKSNFKLGRLQERRGILEDREVARDSAKIALDANKIGLANIHKNNFYATLSVNELSDVIEDMSKNGEKFIEPQPGLKISLEELTQLQLKKKAAIRDQGAASAQSLLDIENAQVGSQVYQSKVQRATLAGILSPEEAVAALRSAQTVASLASFPGGAPIGAKKVDADIKALEEKAKEWVKLQPKPQRAALARYQATGMVANDPINANFVGYEVASTNFDFANPRNPYTFLGNDLGNTINEELTGASNAINFDTISDPASLVATLFKQTGKVDMSIHLKNAAVKANSRNLHSQIIGAELMKSSIRSLAKTSPQFAQLLTTDGEDYKQEFRVKDTVDSDKILQVLSDAEVAANRIAPTGGNVSLSYIEALIERMKNPEFQRSFVDTWMEKHNTFKEKSIIMFLTGGNVLRGVDGYYQDLQIRGKEAIEFAIEQDIRTNRQADAAVRAFERVQEQFPGAKLNIPKGAR